MDIMFIFLNPQILDFFLNICEGHQIAESWKQFFQE